jgi:hypothetical protein
MSPISFTAKAGHRRGELPPDQIRDLSRARVRPGQIAAPAPGDPGDAVLAHPPRHDPSTDRHALALQLAGHARYTIGRMRRVHLEDQLCEPPVVVLAVAALRFGALTSQ